MRQLSCEIGQENFALGLRNIILQNKWGNVTKENFIKGMNLSAFNLNNWFDEWLETVGFDELEGTIDMEGSILEIFST